jgi:hypothetical protein
VVIRVWMRVAGRGLVRAAVATRTWMLVRVARPVPVGAVLVIPTRARGVLPVQAAPVQLLAVRPAVVTRMLTQAARVRVPAVRRGGAIRART